MIHSFVKHTKLDICGNILYSLSGEAEAIDIGMSLNWITPMCCFPSLGLNSLTFLEIMST